LWSGFDPLGELLRLGVAQFVGSPLRRWLKQAGHALEQELVSVLTNGRLTQSQPVRDFSHALALSQGQQGMETFDPFQGTAGIGFLEATTQWFASKRAEV